MPSQFDRPIGASKVCAAFAAGRDDRDRGSASGNFRRCFKRSVWHLRTDYGILSNPREALSQYGRLLLPVLLGAAGGFLLSARAIGFFLTRYEVLSVCLFVGLIVGMLPSMFREAGEKEGAGGICMRWRGRFLRY